MGTCIVGNSMNPTNMPKRQGAQAETEIDSKLRNQINKQLSEQIKESSMVGAMDEFKSSKESSHRNDDNKSACGRTQTSSNLRKSHFQDETVMSREQCHRDSQLLSVDKVEVEVNEDEIEVQEHNKQNSSVDKDQKKRKSRKTCIQPYKFHIQKKLKDKNDFFDKYTKSSKTDKRQRKKKPTQYSLLQGHRSQDIFQISQSTYVGPSHSKDREFMMYHLLPFSELIPLNQEDYIKINQTIDFKKPKFLFTEVKYCGNVTYLGEWVQGKREGKGKMSFPGGVYEGGFYNDMFEGEGEIVFENGEVFQGTFLNHAADGEGTFTYLDGSQYRGNFMQNKPHGKGCLKWTDGGYYEGQWQEGFQNGKGMTYFEDSSYYKGQFNQNEWHGEGEEYKKDKFRYIGEWQHNTKEGKGKMTFANGDVYEGQFYANKMHGEGKMTLKNGRIFEGQWERGKMEGEIRETFGGVTRCGFYSVGKFVCLSSERQSSSNQFMFGGIPKDKVYRCVFN